MYLDTILFREVTKMEYLTTNFPILIFLALLLTFFGFLYRNVNIKQKKALTKVDLSIQRQEQANHHLILILNELKRSNRYLADLAGLEALDSGSQPSDYASDADAGEPMSQTKLYVGNIDYSATDTELASYFSTYGQVEYVNIPVNRYTGKARGFGFVTFTSEQEALRAMELNGSEFKGRQIQVNFAKEREVV